ncbi:MAG: EAL domain-containing protein, partial [Gammaproteobacteria bacterium]|nr:EAL domain-containing protein [Gammaproteobacteria bacterium]
MLIVAPDTQATKCIDHLAKQFTQALHTPIGDMRFHLTFGCTVYPAQSADYASIMLHSNIAVESAISASKQVHYFSNDDGNRHQRRLMITQRLEKAIDDGALTLYFQPKQHLAEGQVKSCESLLRWFDDGTFISPA